MELSEAFSWYKDAMSNILRGLPVRDLAEREAAVQAAINNYEQSLARIRAEARAEALKEEAEKAKWYTQGLGDQSRSSEIIAKGVSAAILADEPKEEAGR